MANLLLTFGALFSIVNPLGGAFIFFGATRELPARVRASLSRWVAIYAFCIIAASLYVGAYVLGFFGISIPVLRVAGGIVIALSAWHLLNHPEAHNAARDEAPGPATGGIAPSRLAFYPLTMPLTTGPGTISVAISLGTSRPAGLQAATLAWVLETLGAVAAVALLVYLLYRHSARLARLLGATGTSIFMRLSAFLLFCIGIQILWNGLAELLGTITRAG